MVINCVRLKPHYIVFDINCISFKCLIRITHYFLTWNEF